MKKVFANVLLLFLLVYSITAMAQPKPVTINGKITSFEESLPLEGVSVRVKGSGNSTGTQADGSFSLSILPEEKILVVSLAGYGIKEVPITNAREYNIVLRRVDNVSFKNQLRQMPATTK
jgi:TonB-dependent starch-binding outer membrane protein SusC